MRGASPRLTGGCERAWPKRPGTMQIQPYLFFSGECEEALNFYHSVFGGEIVNINR